MSALSPPCAHPDEEVCLAAVRFYETRWRPADIREPEAVPTFSCYGVSRLDHRTAYWNLAGKFYGAARRIFPRWRAPERAFNVLIFASLLAFCFIRGRDNPWIFLPLCLSPQIWYLFSYCTSDAWDVTLSILAFHLSAFGGSILWRSALGGEGLKSHGNGAGLVFAAVRPGGVQAMRAVRRTVGIVFCGAVFGLLSLGKPTVLATFLVVGIVILRRLSSLPKPAIRRALPALAVVALVAAAFPMASVAYEHAQYGDRHDAIRQELAEARRSNAFVPDEQGIVEHFSVNLRRRGLSLADTLLRQQPPFLRTNLASFAGSYGPMRFPSPFLWYVAVGLCWTMLFLCGAIRLSRSKPDVADILASAALLAVLALLLCASAWHSWTEDYQPQGRYLFPSNVAWAAIGALCPARFPCRRLVRTEECVMIALLSLGLYSFLFYGLLPLSWL